MMKNDIPLSNNFDRPKLLLFKFLAHQIHPFAYAVNTFLQPALDECLRLLSSNPQHTFNVLLSIAQTFTRFAPESELIYDDIQQFATKLTNAIDQCFESIDENTIQQTSSTLQTIRETLQTLIHQKNDENTTYTDMYKNMSAVATNLEKLNSLPMEMQKLALDKIFPIDESINNNKEQKNSCTNNEYSNKNGNHFPIRTTTITPPPGISSTMMDKQFITASSSIPNQSYASQSTISTTIKSTVDHIKNPSTNSNPLATTASNRPASYINGYEVVDTSTQATKRPTPNIACFPPRRNSSLFTNINSSNEKTSITNGSDSRNNKRPTTLLSEAIKNDQSLFQAPLTKVNKNEMDNTQSNRASMSTLLNGGVMRFSNISDSQTTSIKNSTDDNWNDDDIKIDDINTPHCSNVRSTVTHSKSWCSNDGRVPSSMMGEINVDRTKRPIHLHITDEYLQQFGHKQNRPVLRGELTMTFGKVQSGSQVNCLPIGVGLSYDELTLLSCDVHRSAQTVRLFDIQTGQLKHTISSNQQMKLHRPGAVMSNARNNVLIVERDSIYMTEPDGRLIQTFSHRSIKHLYGIASFRDRYLLTIDSKSTDNQSPEHSRILLFDPNSGQIVFEKALTINYQSENYLKQQYQSCVQGKVLSESHSKPRFLCAHNDDVYIADLGRSLIYGLNIRNQFELSYTTVFGCNGRNNGEMNEPSGLAIDSGGNIISADSKNDRIQIFSSDGQYKTTMKLNEYIRRPSGICTNRDGTQIYVSCYLAGCVRAFKIGY